MDALSKGNQFDLEMNELVKMFASIHVSEKKSVITLKVNGDLELIEENLEQAEKNLDRADVDLNQRNEFDQKMDELLKMFSSLNISENKLVLIVKVDENLEQMVENLEQTENLDLGVSLSQTDVSLEHTVPNLEQIIENLEPTIANNEQVGEETEDGQTNESLERKVENLQIEKSTDLQPKEENPEQTDTSPVKHSEENRLIEQALLMAASLTMTSTLKMFKKFAFWSTQPVVQIKEKVTLNKWIEPKRKITEIRVEPYQLPSGFIWSTVDLDNSEQLEELHTFLKDNYIEDDRNLFRVDCQPEYLKWALKPPGWKIEWHVGVRVGMNGALVAFISGIPSSLWCHDKVIKVVDVNFMCVNKQLRHMRVAPILIREIVRRSNLEGIFQGLYSASILLPTPVSTCRLWHRFLNVQKLDEVRFSALPRNITQWRGVQTYKLTSHTATKGYRPIREEDMDQAYRLLQDYLESFEMCPIFNGAEFRHWFTHRPGVVECFVVADANGLITDLASYLCRTTTVLNHPVHKSVRTAHSFYNVATKTPWVELMNNVLVSAKNSQMDLFTVLDAMDCKKFVRPLKFALGDEKFYYYLYNWQCPPIDSKNIALTRL
ncbi:glycylpeptide N-tetradecanoyltransferase-like [Drosophila ficusphila]|uniref:glycylpeptide N-tetradecanoyltransferase-like n=1 Tax=Drosophila ficusphila TaxID=30025 RepID=UPI0007E7E063|nr:glycylpeptide N-tetradecanoyltransferase-like [Drosophila ficusphila]